MTEVFIVTAGQHDGSWVEAVFTTRELAEAYIDQASKLRYNYEHLNESISVFTLNDTLIAENYPDCEEIVFTGVATALSGRPIQITLDGTVISKCVVEHCDRHAMEPPPADKSWITMEPVSGSKPTGKLRRFFDLRWLST